MLHKGLKIWYGEWLALHQCLSQGKPVALLVMSILGCSYFAQKERKKERKRKRRRKKYHVVLSFLSVSDHKRPGRGRLGAKISF